jgi:hypothetical protein
MPKLSPAAKLLKAKRALAKKIVKKVAAKKIVKKIVKKVAAKKIVKKIVKKVAAKKIVKKVAAPPAPAFPLKFGPAVRPPMTLQEQLKAAIVARKGKINGRPVFGPAPAPFKYHGPQHPVQAAPAHDSARFDLPLAGGRHKARKVRK